MLRAFALATSRLAARSAVLPSAASASFLSRSVGFAAAAQTATTAFPISAFSSAQLLSHRFFSTENASSDAAAAPQAPEKQGTGAPRKPYVTVASMIVFKEGMRPRWFFFRVCPIP